jgi:O-antigen/teichoic acid export membrane protein
MNFSILFLGPIFLVRILDLQTYGQYREFLLYTMLFANFLGFAINSNLLYFVPKEPGKERALITHTAIFSFSACFIGILIIILCRNLILAKISYDFIFPLILYLIFFLNLDFWEMYWLGKKKSEIVLYYSSLRTLIRITVIILIAYFTQNIKFIIYSMIGVELVRFIFVLIYFIHIRGFTKNLKYEIIKDQLTFIIPLGIASTIIYFSNQLGHLFISINLGVNFLALYTIGSYQMPILGIIRSSVTDVIFPEMVQRNKADLLEGLKLWQKKNFVSCFITFPVFIVLFFYAEVFIKVLFTESYLAATPIFRIYLFFMVRQCFEMSSPLRSLNKNKPFILNLKC